MAVLNLRKKALGMMDGGADVQEPVDQAPEADELVFVGEVGHTIE